MPDMTSQQCWWRIQSCGMWRRIRFRVACCFLLHCNPRTIFLNTLEHIPLSAASHLAKLQYYSTRYYSPKPPDQSDVHLSTLCVGSWGWGRQDRNLRLSVKVEGISRLLSHCIPELSGRDLERTMISWVKTPRPYVLGLYSGPTACDWGVLTNQTTN